jgi:hypothetical protein
MEHLPILENWLLCFADNIDARYLAPEQISRHIEGNVYHYSKHQDGSFIRTSKIVEICKDGTIVTESGSVYRLGKPDNKYVEWCQKTGCHIPTPEEPIKIKT